MGSVTLYLKDPAAARFASGGRAEAESLLGSPLPLLPPPEIEEGHGRNVFYVRFHPTLRSLLKRFLQGLLGQLGVNTPGAPPQGDVATREQGEYEAFLRGTLRSVRVADRRLGLFNLCWLAHTRDVAECLRELEAKTPAVRKAKYSLHPLLLTVYRRVDQSARRAVEMAEPGRAAFLLGGKENTALVESLLEDGFAFTELNSAELDFKEFLASNKRYRLPADVFSEIHAILSAETQRRLKDGDRGLLARVARHMPGLPKEQYQSPSGVLKIVMNSAVLTYLLGDVWNVGNRLMSSPRVKAEAERRPPAEIMDAFVDLITGVKRFEIVSHVRDRVRLVQEQLEELAKQDKRIYEFGESTQVLNNAVNATVLFLDLRGFTQTSEGYISERDLTRELYAVFDAFVPHIARFGGTVDKFLGDGIMVTYGTERVNPLDPLNALRSAIMCQETIIRLREQGKTYFKMGVSVHYGRVYLAHFIADEESVQTTVIGRNVNLSGRLSSAAKKPMDEDAPEEPAPASKASGLQVTVDGTGTLLNEGIAISRDTLVQLEKHLPLVHGEDGDLSVMEYFDDVIGRRILIRYAGDAKFKGVRSSFPVYSVDFEV